MSFDFLFGPVEALDAWLTGLFDGAPLLVALGDRRSCSGCATPPTPTTSWR